MTKVTITSAADGNESAEIPARAADALTSAVGVHRDLGWECSGPLYDRKRDANDALDALVRASADARTPEIAAALTASAEAEVERKFVGLLHNDAFTETYKTLRQNFMGTWGRFEAATVFDSSGAPVGGRELHEEAEAAGNAAVKALLEYAPTSIAEIADKMALLERARCCDNYEDYASILRDLQQLSGPPAAPGSSAPTKSPIGPGHAISPALPDPTTPFAQAVALRDRLRAEVQAYEDEHDVSVRIPRDRGHEFHGKVGADSTRRWARIPRDHGRPLI